MNNNTPAFSLGARVRSVRHAVSGVAEMLRSQHNAWIHLVATLLVVAMAFAFAVSTLEWCLLILSITAVWVSEALNTAFEFLCDVASPEFHPLVKKSKDVAAGAVLLCAISATFIGLILFIPYISALI
ncbi:MAG: diacylglycerol kinase family protein [Pseudomonadota bacterium]